MTKTCSECGQKKQFPKDFVKGKKKKDGSYSYSKYCNTCKNLKIKKQRHQIGQTKRLTHMPVKNLVGERFGKLIVIEYNNKKTTKRQKLHTWLCQCDCGNTKIVVEPSLKTGQTKSCGCLRKRNGKNNLHYKGHQQISGTVWSRIKYGAKTRNLEFSITIEYAWELFQKQNSICALSGLELYFSKCSKTKRTASLDRIDSSKGYIEGNIQWVHRDINYMKYTHTQQYFLELCSLVINHNS